MYWVTGLLGLLLILAPYILGYSDHAAALWSSGVLGLGVVLVSAYKALARDEGTWEYAAAIILGLLAVVAPFALGFGTHGVAVWTSIGLGVVVAILAGYRLLAQPQPQ